VVVIQHPSARVQYSLEETTKPDLADILAKFLKDHAPRLSRRKGRTLRR
jgi:hypothetical protein